MSPAVGILGCGSYLPEWEVPNREVAVTAGVDPAWIEAKTGILTRRRAAPDQAASDLAGHAAEDALRRAGIAAGQLSVIVVATSTPDSPQPPTACLLQHRIGAVNAAAFDVNAVCTGFLFALDIARRMIDGGGYALVVGVDVYSRILDFTDHRTAVLFGDGAGAVVLGAVPAGRGIRAVRLRSHGEHHELIGVPAGGSRIPPSKESVLAGQHYFLMKGRAVREFVAREVPAAVREFLAGNDVDRAAVRHHIPHQANARVIEELERELDLPGARTHYTVHRFGNTAAASVPVTMAAAHDRMTEGDLVLLTAFGGGMATGMALLNW
jgi:3-oxoacyl-(acyl-carrier-protein) synthase III